MADEATHDMADEATLRPGDGVMVPISELRRDLDLYPRNKLDPMHIRRLSEALEMGAKFPPITVDRKTKIITDGWHRTGAVEHRFGENGEIEVVWEDHEDIASIFLRAAGEAAVSKLPLTPYDQARIVVRAEELGVPLERVASVLQTPVEKLRGRVSLATMRPSAHSPGLATAGTVLLKGSMRHLEGHELTPEQVEANRKAAGMGVTFYANQVSLQLEADTVNWTDQRTRKALQRLYEDLSQQFALREAGGVVGGGA